jgi:hypothetical protein
MMSENRIRSCCKSESISTPYPPDFDVGVVFEDEVCVCLCVCVYMETKMGKNRGLTTRIRSINLFRVLCSIPLDHYRLIEFYFAELILKPINCLPGINNSLYTKLLELQPNHGCAITLKQQTRRTM